jgi:hypothetical protein
LIITQTPYRVSFAGGGTDLPAFYSHEPGAVLSVGVSHHMYITVSPRFDATTRVAYSRTEIADDVAKIEHTIAREALRMTGLGPHLEITTVGDVPAGTGMGSSSSLAVGLLNALYAYKGRVTSPSMLAEKACEIEIDILKQAHRPAGPGCRGLRGRELHPLQPRSFSGRGAGALRARVPARTRAAYPPALHGPAARCRRDPKEAVPRAASTRWACCARCATLPERCGRRWGTAATSRNSGGSCTRGGN